MDCVEVGEVMLMKGRRIRLEGQSSFVLSLVTPPHFVSGIGLGDHALLS
jgi:hypothetical protein